MAEVVSPEPVHIENVNLIINVYNIANDGTSHVTTIDSNGVLSQLPQLPDSVSHISSEAPFAVLENSGSRSEPNATTPLGWIANYNDDLIPFGVKPVIYEIGSFGDRRTWKEIRVILPPLLLTDLTDTMYCPVSWCRERLPNKSIHCHILKHLGIVSRKSVSPSEFINQPTGAPSYSNNECGLPCPIGYYCSVRSCQYYVEKAEKSFKAYKNLRQHYQKTHAPKPFECDLCKKTFPTQKVLESHKLMCGEVYLCMTCHVTYNSLEVLQTHCRRKSHVYDHEKYKGIRHSAKQEVQSKESKGVSPNSSARKVPKILRKYPTPILPKASNETVFKEIQAYCQQQGYKVDYGCQTVCTAIIQKSDPVQSVATPSASTSPPVTQKKRKSTDTQTNIVKFRATGLDQKHNATNTNQDWKKVITSDSETQTAEHCESVDLTQFKFHDKSNDTSAHFNNEFATIKISETDDCQFVLKLGDSQDSATQVETNYPEPPPEPTTSTIKVEATSAAELAQQSETPLEIKDLNSPDLFQDFMSMLEVDSATQTEPDIFENLGGDMLGINVSLDEFCDREDAYVSVSSTASQTAGEKVPKISLSAEDYEQLLSINQTQSDLMTEEMQDFSSGMEEVMNLFDKPSTSTATSEEELALELDSLFDWENLTDLERSKN